MGMDFVIRENELRNHPGLHDLKRLESREDVATLLDRYELLVSNGISPIQISTVKEDNQHNYYFVIGEKKLLLGFDIVSFVSMRYTLRKVTNANIKLLFPLRLSRYKSGRGSSSHRDPGSSKIPRLLYQKENVLITIPRDGDVVIGRSERNTNFQIKNNENVSRVHCRVYYDKDYGVAKVVDCNSQNGTFLDGKRIYGEPVSLRVGETISIAGEKFLVVM